ncbi:glycosyltransferase, partial [Microbacterium sp. p3-SID337]
VGPSLRERALAERLVPAEKIVVLGAGSPNGVDVRQFGDARHDATARSTMREHLGIPASAQIVVFMGRLTADKGLAALAEAMAVVQQHSHAWLVIVGGIDDASGVEGERLLREAVARLVVVGEVADVRPYLAAADVFCLPSRREGMPTVVLEAFAARVPVVATRATGIVDLVTDGKTGWLVPVDNAPALARALRQALDDRETARRMADAAAALVSERFDREIVQRTWISTLEQIRQQSRGSR